MTEKQIDREIEMLDGGRSISVCVCVCVLEIRVEWIRRLSYVCGCERDEDRVHVTHIQTNIGEK